jgi:hypothetical protein
MNNDRPEVDERHQRAIREVVHDIHQACHHKRRMGFQGSSPRVHYEQDVGTADKAELVEDSVRVILHNTKSRITADKSTATAYGQ